MANIPFEIPLALEHLRAPLNVHPITPYERYINEIRVKFRSYYVEYNTNDGAVRLPRLFADDFGDEIGRLATLVDVEGNQFEVLVDKVNENIYLTRGWAALQKFYNIRIGAWIQLVYTGMGHFGLIMRDRFHDPINPPIFVPPVKMVIDKYDLPPYFVDDLPDSPELLAYDHDPAYFQYNCDKLLTHSDISAGFLMLPYHGFGEHVFHATTSSIKLVDDTGNAWTCTLDFVPAPVQCFKVGGQWSVIVATRRFVVGDHIRIGAQGIGTGEVIYFEMSA